MRDTKFVKDLDNDKLACRTLRHAWNISAFALAAPEDFADVQRPEWANQVIKREMSCVRCDTVKIVLFGRSSSRAAWGARFNRFYTRYIYPKGYQFRKTEHTDDRPLLMDYESELYTRYGQGLIE